MSETDAKRRDSGKVTATGRFLEGTGAQYICSNCGETFFARVRVSECETCSLAKPTVYRKRGGPR